MKKIILFVLVAASGASCTDESKSFENRLSGYYKIVALQSNTIVDLNNDGLKTADLYHEISMPHNTISGTSISMYDFESPANYMEIRPLKSTTNNAKLIAINFPEQYIDQSSNGDFFLMIYLHSFNTCMYDFIPNSNQIDLIYTGTDGTLNKFELQPEGTLKLELTKQVFDFKELAWINVNITAVYQKVK